MDVFNRKVVKTRKNHVCFGCGREFPKGTKMEVSNTVDGNTIWTCYLCNSCQIAESELRYDDEYGFGELRERALEIEKGGDE